MNEAKVSLIVPVYNVSAYLDTCVASLVAQTYPHLEILLVDDGSTDDSGEKCETWAQKDPRIRVFHQTNGGLSAARNTGLEQATGQWLAFVDSDDTIEATMMETMLNKADATQADICVCDMVYIHPDGSRVEASGGDFEEGSVQQNPALIRINNSACNKIFHQALWANHRFPVGKYYEDLAVIPVLLYEAKKLVHVAEPFYHYLQRSGSIAHTANPKIFDIYAAITGCIKAVQAQGNEPVILDELKKDYIVHGLDLTTLRIKDFDDASLRIPYLKENMEHLRAAYPDYRQNELVQKAPFKKKLIYHLLEKGNYAAVLKLYGR